MNKKDLESMKARLIEKLGVQLEKEHQLAPVSARIFATIIMSGRQGITFDELVQFLKAGKSTVSTHLENLQVSNRIEYFTKSGDRKRYFIVKPDLMNNYINELTTKWEAQRAVHLEVLEFKKLSNEYYSDTENPQFDLEFQQSLLTFFDEASEALEKLKAKIKTIQNNNH